eukprot:c29612_g1_i1 orf=3-437(-)
MVYWRSAEKRLSRIMSGMEWPELEIDEYEKFLIRMNPPRVVIDNTTCNKATLIKVDSANRHGVVLDVVQILTDFELTIHKAYISSDCGWVMYVFHVTDRDGNKVRDERLMECIQQRITVNHQYPQKVELKSSVEHTALELTGTDR